MLIQLANEVWMEILGWLKREKLAHLLDQLPGDHQFTEIVQTWLHELDKNVQLGELGYVKQSSNAPVSLYRLNPNVPDVCVPIAVVPMPNNIVNFDIIEISYMDSTILRFLRLTQRLLTNNVNLCIAGFGDPDEDDDQFNSHAIGHANAEPYNTALTHLMPLFSGGIDSINCYETTCCQLMLFLRDNFSALLFGTRLIQLDIFSLGESVADLLTDWLCTPRADEKPRVLVCSIFDEEEYMMLCQKIRKRFVSATGPSSPFFFRCDATLDQETTFENGVTGEQLISRNAEHEYEEEAKDAEGKPLAKKVKKTKEYSMITRCSSGVDKAWLKAEECKLVGMGRKWAKGRCFWLNEPEIGQIDDEQQQSDEAKQSTSSAGMNNNSEK